MLKKEEMNYSEQPCTSCGDQPKPNCTSCNAKTVGKFKPCPSCKKKGCGYKPGCQECTKCNQKTILGIDDPNGLLWKDTMIGPAPNPYTGGFINFQMPFGWIDFQDLGRSGQCKDNPGRIYQDGEGHIYNYKDFGFTVSDGSGQVLYKKDNRIPIEALSPYARCPECSSNPEDNCGTCQKCPDEDCNCPQSTPRTICKNGKCIVEWGPALTVEGDGCVDLEYNYETNKITASFQLKYEECNTISIEEIDNCGDCDENCNKCKTYKWCVVYQDTNTVDLFDDENGLGANVRYQNSCSTTISEDENGLQVDVNLCDTNTIELDCGTDEDGCTGISARVRIAGDEACPNNILVETDDGLCTNICAAISDEDCNQLECRNGQLFVRHTPTRLFSGQQAEQVDIATPAAQGAVENPVFTDFELVNISYTNNNCYCVNVRVDTSIASNPRALGPNTDVFFEYKQFMTASTTGAGAVIALSEAGSGGGAYTSPASFDGGYHYLNSGTLYAAAYICPGETANFQAYVQLAHGAGLRPNMSLFLKETIITEMLA